MEWKEIPEIKGYYVNKSGDVVDKSGKPVKTRVDSKGYLSVSKTIHVRLHKAIMVAFSEKGENTLVRHLDGNKSNNNITNLRWGTSLDNIKDSISHGTHICLKRGSEKSLSKLSDIDVLTIRKRAEAERLTDIARDYPVDVSTVGKIARRDTWTHI